MSLELQFTLVAVLSFVGAACAETFCWAMLARRDVERRGMRVWVGILAACVVGTTTVFGMSGLELSVRLWGGLAMAAGYAYARWRLRVSDLLMRLGLHLAGTKSLKVKDPRRVGPIMPRSEKQLMLIVVIVAGPVISAILYPQMRVYALVWAAIVAVPAGVILWRRFAASNRRS